MEKLQANKKASELIKVYNSLIGEQTNFSALIMGLAGSGKTTLLTTGRLPLLVDHFDPRGTVVFRTDPTIRSLIEKGAIVVRPFWNERSTAPTEYARWEKQWMEDIKSGFLNSFGTYAIDSGTTHLEAMTNYICSKKGRGDNLQIQDYPVIYNMLRDIIKISSSQECDFLYTGHLVDVENLLTSEITAELDTYSKLKSRVPILFTEKYVMFEKAVPSGNKRLILTGKKGRFRASTQLGAKGIFDLEEEPNIKALLKKAGLPITDKPFFKL